VKLFQGTTQLAQATVSGKGNWAYTDIAPVAVAAGTQYTVGRPDMTRY